MVASNSSGVIIIGRGGRCEPVWMFGGCCCCGTGAVDVAVVPTDVLLLPTTASVFTVKGLLYQYFDCVISDDDLFRLYKSKLGIKLHVIPFSAL